MKTSGLLALVLVASVACAAHEDDASSGDAGASTDAQPIDPDAALLGGETTVFDDSPSAYSRPARNLSSGERDIFSLGDHFFGRNWVSAPASTSDTDGLGPMFNATSCSSCHLKDGRSKPPQSEKDSDVGLLLRLTGADAYGGQLQTHAVVGVPVEGEYVITYAEEPGTFADGEAFSLRKPTYEITKLAYGPLPEGTLMSPRTAPAMIGLGLLENVPAETLVAMSDPDDRDGDGISGRTNMVTALDGERVVGRFGWKANVASVEQQVAGAFTGDLGITTRFFPDEGCTAAEPECQASPNGGKPELPDDTLDDIVLYSRTLAVPARRKVDDEIARRGERAFVSAGCAACHAQKLVTSDASPIAALRKQTIRPFTDLLLHDMGPGLADGRPDFEASGSEWRSAPLWGIGLLMTVSKHSFLLHDGRARNASEAILWHGGEAQRARDAFLTMSKDDRAALLAFLASL